MNFLRDDNKITFNGYRPVDRNHPESACSAIEVTFPTGLSQKAQKCWKYFDGSAFAFIYKGRLVITDEALELTVAGDGSYQNPFGGPRWVVDSWEELEKILEEVYDELVNEEMLQEA